MYSRLSEHAELKTGRSDMPKIRILTLSGPGFFGVPGPGIGGGGGSGKCPRPITLKLFMVLKENLVE